MASSLTILTESFIGRHYEFTLERREGDTAWMRIEIWNSSLDHRRDDPSKDDVVNLYDIRFDKVRRLLFKAKMNGSYPLITIGFNPAKDEKKPFLRVVLTDTFAYMADLTLDYTVEPADYDKLLQFLLEQDFPDIEASVIRNEKAVIKPGFAGPMTGSATKGR
jgi:hypothetical protein